MDWWLLISTSFDQSPALCGIIDLHMQNRYRKQMTF